VWLPSKGGLNLPLRPESGGPKQGAFFVARAPIRLVCREIEDEAVAARKNERRFPHIIQIATSPHGLDAKTSRSILDFHRSRNIQVRFGHAIKNLCRWCFSERATAAAFKEQFGGTYVVKIRKTTVKRTMPNVIAMAFISDSIAYLMSSGAELAAQIGLI